jgi:hypothetical protein
LAGTSLARADAQSDFGPATWIRIPKIGVDSHITDVGIIDRIYDVPWFDVGHHADWHPPGEFGNSIFNGHVATINAGEVFRHLDQLQPDDAVYIYTPVYRLDWASVTRSRSRKTTTPFWPTPASAASRCIPALASSIRSSEASPSGWSCWASWSPSTCGPEPVRDCFVV